MNDKIKDYPSTEHCKVIDTIGVPHAYCIGSKLVAFASDNYNGMLGEEAIIAAEKVGITCEVKGCTLTYEQHEQALLIECNTVDNEVIQSYLESIVDRCRTDGFAGFNLIRAN